MKQIKKIFKLVLGDIHKRDVYWNILYFCRFFYPIRADRYISVCMKGHSCGCNNKYLTQYIQDVDHNSEIIWAFAPEFYEKFKDIVKNSVIIDSWKYYKVLFTSHYLIANDRTGNEYPFKREGQIYLQTWHGSGPKKAEAEMTWSDDSYKNQAIKDSKKIDIVISGNHYQTAWFKRAFWYDGRIIETGTPRCDIFFQEHPEIIMKVSTNLGIDLNKKIVLYAPTLRNIEDLTNQFDLDVLAMIKKIEDRFGGEYVFVYRLHPDMASENDQALISSMFPNSINATYYPDMQELLFSTEILITDYSSCSFDFMLTKRLCLLYIKDAETFERGFYFKFDELPFPSFDNQNSFTACINSFDKMRYRNNLDKFINETIGVVEDGHASERCYKLLKSL